MESRLRKVKEVGLYQKTLEEEEVLQKIGELSIGRMSAHLRDCLQFFVSKRRRSNRFFLSKAFLFHLTVIRLRIFTLSTKCKIYCALKCDVGID